MLLLRNRMLSLLYTTILKEFGTSAIKEIFCSPLVINETKVNQEELFKMLINKEDYWIPLPYLFQIFKNIEGYINSIDYSHRKFIEILLGPEDAGLPILSSQEILQVIEPYLYEAFSQEDLHNFILKMTCQISNYCIPNSIMKVIKTNKEKTCIINYVELIFDKQRPQLYVYNVDLWRSSQLQRSTTGFNIPYFDQVEAIAEVEPVKMFLDIDHLIEHDNKLFFRKEQIGYRIKYSHFLSQHGIAHSAFLKNDPIGVVMTSTIQISNTRNLKKGCFYGAPCYVIKSIHKPFIIQRDRILKRFIHSNINGQTVQDPIVLKRHNHLVSNSNTILNISYCKHNRKLYFNGKLLAREIPAQILFYFCVKYSEQQKETFTYQELIISNRINLPANRPNLYVRLQRLREKLIKDAPSLKITHEGKGTCSFKSEIPFKLTLLN